MMKKYLCILAVLLFFVLNSGTSHACTGVYIGKEASADGTFILARSNDCPEIFATRMMTVPRVEWDSGREMPVDNNSAVFAQLPETTYKYTATPFMDSTISISGTGMDDAVCVNEYGVTMTMSVTAFSNEAALAADPWVCAGLTEFTANQLVISTSTSAREAVRRLTKLLDQYGSAETNIAMIADQTEAWYMEIYTGHQYAAVKLTDDEVSVFGNEFSLEYLSDYEECLFSPDLEKLARENGFAVYGDSGELNLWETYSGAGTVTEYSHMRTWIGHKLLAPASYGDYRREDRYPLLFRPENKVSLQTVMEIMRNRYEGTEYSPDETGRIDMRVIGTDTALSVHVVQLDPSLPPALAGTTWVSLAPAVYGVFVPMNILCTEPSEAYGANQPQDNYGRFESDRYPWFTFKELNTLCLTDYRVYGTPVREYWHRAETQMIEGMAAKRAQIGKLLEKDPAEAQKQMTEYCAGLQEKAFEDAKELLNQVRWTMSFNSNTMKLGKNPETGEYLTTERVLSPVTVTLDGSAYGRQQSIIAN